MISLPHYQPGAPAPLPNPDEGVDAREQLVNGGEIGPIGRVSVPETVITRLLGIMLDFDLDLYKPEKLPAGATASAVQLYETFVGPMLQRHPLYARAEVWDTGRGLHAILWFDPPVEFGTPAEREKWAAVVKAVQKALPTDPHCAGITATTRPVGSTNGKTGRPVRTIKPGEPVTAAAVLDFVTALRQKPFKTVAGFLLDPAAPACPVCATPGTRLGVGDTFGHCYGGKHRPKVGDLFDAVFAAPTKKGG